MRNTIILCLAALMAPLAQAQGPTPQRAEVLVLGLFHMSNPGQDIFNMQVDDVLAPKRQQEIAELVAVLEKFKPTKIAVEYDSQRKLNERYAKYVAGQHVLTANEIDQLGLRMAKELSHGGSMPTAISRSSASSITPRPPGSRPSSTRSWERSARW
jgi:hypothetical protein